jgi:hypothetical protein
MWQIAFDGLQLSDSRVNALHKPQRGLFFCDLGHKQIAL